jgi:hypothetical protein
MPTSGTGVELLLRPDAGRRQPGSLEATHALPRQAAALERLNQCRDAWVWSVLIAAKLPGTA